MLENTTMNRFEDKRISEALELLNAAARDNKSELQSAIENKYTDLSSVVNAFTDQMKNRATEGYNTGRRRVMGVATNINGSVHKNPWAYIGGAVVVGILSGLILCRTRRN
jgi:ElaB/YqjD/DUF883 family membrane-anchored ribosome-binding protein